MKTYKANIFKQAWDFVRRFGFTMSEALRTAWANAKFRVKASTKIVEFYFKKVDGTTRQAFGTICCDLVPETSGDDRRKCDDVQTYYDTEKQAWRCFKKQNLLRVC